MSSSDLSNVAPKPSEASWKQRKWGAMKKADDLFRFFGAKSAALIERGGLLYAYQSHSDFPLTLPGVVVEHQTPKHFISAAEQEKSSNKPFTVKDIEKSWRQRKRGAMKKADDMFRLFDAKSALLVERDGLLCTYQSHPDFPPTLPGVVVENQTPKHFISAADDEHKETPKLSPALYPTPGALDAINGWGMRRANHGNKETTSLGKDKYRVTKNRKEIPGRTYFTRLGAKR